MQCAKCNYDNPADAQFCTKCGTNVENRCSSYNSVNPADANFYRYCGGALGAGVLASSPSPTNDPKLPASKSLMSGRRTCLAFCQVLRNMVQFDPWKST